MSRAAHNRILGASWDEAYEMTYCAYRFCHENHGAASALANRNSLLARPPLPAA
jgi:hypothetical protein